MTHKIGVGRPKWIAAALAVSISAWCATATVAHAEQVLGDLEDPVAAEITTALSSETAQAGQPFKAVLTENVRYNDWVIPEGTVFNGEVERANDSRTFGRAGYIVLNVNDAVLPTGTTFTFDKQKYQDRDKKIHHEDAQTFQQSFIEQLPYTATTVAVSVPLKYGTDMDRWEIFPIALGARMALGASMALFDDDLQEDPVPTRIAKGAWRGTGVPRAYNFITPSEELVLEEGSVVPLYFDPEALTDLFQSANSAPVVRVTE